VVKFQTTYLQASAFRALWTILGILALAFLMTPKFFPTSSEISQTVLDKPKVTKSSPSTKRTDQRGVWAHIQKFLQARSNIQHSQTPAKKL
jgi:hypothetical protein